MELLLLVTAALLPAAFLMIRTWLSDTHEKEPKTVVIATVMVGFALPLVCYWPERLLSDLFALMNLGRLTTGLLNAFFVAGLLEELGKFAVFYLLIYNNDNFNEPFDGIIYSVAISLGFAGFENVLYVILSWMSIDAPTAWSVVQSRTLLALPQHFMCGMFMGYYFGRARFAEDARRKRNFVAAAFFVPFLLHGLYDAVLEVFSDRGVLVCLLLLAVQYFLARRFSNRLLARSPFITTSRARLARHIHHAGHRQEISAWPWKR